ncbi:MAG TPA: class I SAM-dependent methyltransferase [Burkholderiales bacterium]|jgi:SAM-dependent methyltransferase
MPVSPDQPARRRFCAALGLTAVATAARAQTNLITSDGSPVRVIEVPFVVTPNETVRAMLDLAEVKADDVVYDLGCGDGRIIIAAAQLHGARGVGVEIDPKLVETARREAHRAGVEERVRIEQGDLFQMDFRDATVVMLYLSESINLRLWPKFLQELKPGARVVSHKFPMGDHVPERTVHVGYNDIYLWHVPGAAR